MDNYIKNLITEFEERIQDPTKGLHEDIFYFVSRLTPLINVDLLVRNENGEVLLSWRNKITFQNKVGSGWHIPGGIIRLRETVSDRLHKVALHEMGGELASHSESPIAINQCIDHMARDRSHFISLLYECKLSKDYKINNKNLESKEPGYLEWHKGVPDNLIANHNIYRKFLK